MARRTDLDLKNTIDPETNPTTMNDRSAVSDLGLLLIRLMLAVVFAYHGSQKMFGAFGGAGLEGMSGWLGSKNVPMPYVAAVLAASSQLLGSLSLLTGLFFRPLMVPLAFTMFVAVFVGHSDDPYGKYEFALTLAVVVTGLALTGPGAFAFRIGGGGKS